MKVYLFLSAVSDFDVTKVQVLGYDDVSTGILKPEDGRKKSTKRHIREHLNLDQGGLENLKVKR